MWLSCDYMYTHHDYRVACDYRDYHVTIMWLHVHTWLSCSLWLSCDYHVTIMWLHVHTSWLSCSLWLSCDYHVIIMWLSCDYHVIMQTRCSYHWTWMYIYRHCNYMYTHHDCHVVSSSLHHSYKQPKTKSHDIKQERRQLTYLILGHSSQICCGDICKEINDKVKWLREGGREGGMEGGREGGRERWEAGRGMPTWNLPGPIWMVFISVWQLHFLVPGADWGTGLYLSNWGMGGRERGKERRKKKSDREKRGRGEEGGEETGRREEAKWRVRWGTTILFSSSLI